MLRVVACLALMIASAVPAEAAGADRGKDALKRFCSGDATTFCGDVDPGNRRAMDACFKRHMGSLSPGCRKAIQSYRKAGGR